MKLLKIIHDFKVSLEKNNVFLLSWRVGLKLLEKCVSQKGNRILDPTLPGGSLPTEDADWHEVAENANRAHHEHKDALQPEGTGSNQLQLFYSVEATGGILFHADGREVLHFEERISFFCFTFLTDCSKRDLVGKWRGGRGGGGGGCHGSSWNLLCRRLASPRLQS